MATVHSIDVALRATTGQFDKNLLESAGLTRREFNSMKKSVASTRPAIDVVNESLEQFDAFAKAGAFTVEQYREGSERLKKEIAAAEQGFDSFANAFRVDQVLGNDRSTLERYQAEVKTLERAQRAGAATSDDVAKAKRRYADEAQRVADAEKQKAADAKAAALGLGSMSQALSRSEAIMRQTETAEERLNRQTQRPSGANNKPPPGRQNAEKCKKPSVLLTEKIGRAGLEPATEAL